MTKASEVVGQADEVNHPRHYKYGAIEAIEVIEDWGLGFHLGNAVKYICRVDRKGALEGNLRKAIWYLERYIVYRRRKDAKPGDVQAEPIDLADEKAVASFYEALVEANADWHRCECEHCLKAATVDADPELVWKLQGMCHRYQELQKFREIETRLTQPTPTEPIEQPISMAEAVAIAGMKPPENRDTRQVSRWRKEPGGWLLVDAWPIVLARLHPEYDIFRDDIRETKPLEFLKVTTADGQRDCWVEFERATSSDGKFVGMRIVRMHPDVLARPIEVRMNQEGANG